jgi:hypothetical protein
MERGTQASLGLFIWPYVGRAVAAGAVWGRCWSFLCWRLLLTGMERVKSKVVAWPH